MARRAITAAILFCFCFAIEALSEEAQLQWAWMSGSDQVDQLGMYGELGNGSVFIYPGARQGAAGYYDSVAQELWLFGGFDRGSSDDGSGA